MGPLKETAILINRGARSGKAILNPNEIDIQLKSHQLVCKQKLVISGDNINSRLVGSFIHEAAKSGIRKFVVLGGDGSVSLMISQFIQMLESESYHAGEFQFGAIGTGSSNDFHKITPGIKSKNCPTRLNFNRTISQDIFYVRSSSFCVYGVNNFSMGYTTEANQSFNHPGAALKLLKKMSPDIAIAVTAFKQLIKLRSFNILYKTSQNNSFEPLRFNNLGIVKNPNIAGSFRYPGQLSEKPGYLGFHRIHSCNRMHFFKILFQLISGHFPSDRNRSSCSLQSVEIKSDQCFHYEVDGEVYQSNQIRIGVYPTALNFAT